MVELFAGKTYRLFFVTQQHKLFQKAQKAFSAGNYGLAEKHLRKLLKSKELYVPARILLSKVLFPQNRAAEAADLLAEAARQQADNPALWKATGEIYAKIGNHEQAVVHLEQALAQTPQIPDLWIALLESLLHCYTQSQAPSQQALDDLLALSTKAVELFSSSLGVIHIAGQICFAAKLYEPAAQYLEACLNADPINLTAHHRWLEIHHIQENYAPVRAYAEKYADKIKNDPLCNRVIAKVFEHNGEMHKAITYINRAIELKPGDAEYIGSKGRILYYLGQFEEALPLLDQSIALDSHQEASHMNRCLVHKKLGNIDKAAFDEPYRFLLKDNNPKFQLAVPLWDGSPLGKRRLFIWSDQGVGDLFKYALLLHSLDCPQDQIILCAQAKTVAFLKHVFPKMDIRPFPRFHKPPLPKGETHISPIFDAIEEDFDCHIPIGMLYAHLRPGMASFREQQTKFELAETVVAPFRNLDILANPQTVKVGIAWSSKNRNPIVERNYLELEDLLPFLKLPGFEFFNFQYDASEEEINQFRATHNVPLYHAPGLDLFDDLLGTAAFNSCMDLFFSPASTCSDIAGSLGIKSLRADLEHLPENLGQDFVPWYMDQKCISIPYTKTIRDFFPQMQDWLMDQKDLMGK